MMLIVEENNVVEEWGQESMINSEGNGDASVKGQNCTKHCKPCLVDGWKWWRWCKRKAPPLPMHKADEFSGSRAVYTMYEKHLFWTKMASLTPRCRAYSLGLGCKVGIFMEPFLDFDLIWKQVANSGLYCSTYFCWCRVLLRYIRVFLEKSKERGFLSTYLHCQKSSLYWYSHRFENHIYFFNYRLDNFDHIC